MLAAVGQLCSTSNLALNAKLCTSIIRRAAAASARIVLLPEACDFLGVPPEETHKYSQSLDDSEFVRAVKGQARDSEIWVGVGVHEKAEEDPKKCYNVHLVRRRAEAGVRIVDPVLPSPARQLISPQGQIVQRYKKIHLFDAKHSGKSILESNTTLPGKELMDPVETPVGKRAFRGDSSGEHSRMRLTLQPRSRTLDVLRLAVSRGCALSAATRSAAHRVPVCLHPPYRCATLPFHAMCPYSHLLSRRSTSLG